VDELYAPLKESEFFHEHDWIFPHDGTALYNSRETLKTVDLFIVEVSNPATWLGIEIGFASIYGKRILCIHKRGTIPANSLSYIIDNFIEYDDIQDMVDKIWNFLKNI
jgi:hypothetical protein